MTTVSTDPNLPDDAAPDGARSIEAPGPGVWERDIDHETRPRTRLFLSVIEPAFADGFGHFLPRYGLPLARAEYRGVDGWSYMRMVAVGESDKNAGSPPPPDFVMKVLSRVHPELRRRARTARAAVADRRWLRDVQTWNDERAGWVEQLDRAQRVSYDGVGDADVATAVGDDLDRAQALTTRHFELLGPGLGIGIFLSACEDWGVDIETAVAALGGGSQATSATRSALRAIADAAGPATSTAKSLDELRAVGEDVDGLIDDYVGEFGWRTLNDDVDQPVLAERPAALLRSIQAAARDDAVDMTGDTEIPHQIAAADTARYRELLADARRCMECLDDNSGLTTWGVGVSRRSLLEAGRRLADRSSLSHADHVFELDRDEIEALLVGRPGPSAVEVAGRAEARRAAAEQPPPVHLGGEPSAPPSPDVFPADMGRMVRAIGLFLGQRFQGGAGMGDGSAVGEGEVRADGELLASGIGIDLGTASGRACVVATPDEALDRLEPGDVLVCPTTTPAYNAVFPIAAAVVTQFGGTLGHAAVTARELGIPAVVGVGDHRIADGQAIDVAS